MRRYALGLLALGLAAGLVAAGCGGSDDNSTSTEAALTKAPFVQKGNAICKAGNQKINQAFNQIQGSPTQAQAEQVVTTTVIPSIQGQIDDIRNLGIPSGDETQVNKILNDAQSALDQVKKDPSLITQNGADPFAQANKEASAYGLTVCGSG